MDREEFNNFYNYMVERGMCETLTDEKLDEAWKLFESKKQGCDMLFDSESEDAKYDKEMELMEEAIKEV